MRSPDIDILTPAEAARVIGVGPGMVRYLERIGKLRALRTRTGRRIFMSADVEVLAARRLANKELRRRK